MLLLLLLAPLIWATSFDIYADEPVVGLEYERLSNASLLWGPYRSGHYFGVRPRVPRSLLLGLMWYHVDSYLGATHFRHFYDQRDPMDKANWVEYDPRVGGRQVISDPENHVNVTIDFVKSDDGLSWGARVNSVPHEGYENVKTLFVWYSGLEGERESEDDLLLGKQTSGYLNLETLKEPYGYLGDIKLAGLSEELGLFELTVTEPKSNKHPKPVAPRPDLDSRLAHHLSLHVPDDKVWMAKDIYVTMLQDSIQEIIDTEGSIQGIPPHQLSILRDTKGFEGNLHFIQKIYRGKATFDVIFNNAMSHDKITPENLGGRIKNALAAFNEKYSRYFPAQAPFNDPKYAAFGKEVVSGLLGGLSYFYGNHLVDRTTQFEEDSFEAVELHGELEGPHELFTLVPSRPFFPRGFLWDEGFHLLPLLEYDSDLVLEIVKSWFSLIDDNGWIAREQILGPEARARVPEQFQVQSPHIVNPPTLMLTFAYLLEQQKQGTSLTEPVQEPEFASELDLGQAIVQDRELLTNFTRDIYPQLKLHFEGYRRSQQGYVDEFDRGSNAEAYRWRGRTLTHCLASGLDDYPRALPADTAELNVDLLTWIGIMARSVRLVAEVLDLGEDVHHYTEIERNVLENLNKLHWSDKHKSYCDVSVDEDDEDIHVCHQGYVTILPMLTKMLPLGDEHIPYIVDTMADPEHLWTEYGLRSLSKSDEYYKTGEDYWRSPIWVHMNYLALDSLRHYKGSQPADTQAKMARVYRDLRVNVVQNVYREWVDTGFVWENYDDTSGAHRGAKNFLGWTSTVILMMKMPENI